MCPVSGPECFLSKRNKCTCPGNRFLPLPSVNRLGRAFRRVVFTGPVNCFLSFVQWVIKQDFVHHVYSMFNHQYSIISCHHHCNALNRLNPPSAPPPPPASKSKIKSLDQLGFSLRWIVLTGPAHSFLSLYQCCILQT